MDNNHDLPTLHLDPDKFKSLLASTADATEFHQRLIEKDFFCTLVLHHLVDTFKDNLIFKGGTSLSKVHANFYRLSEDLDFIISTGTNVSRNARRKSAEVAIKDLVLEAANNQGPRS